MMNAPITTHDARDAVQYYLDALLTTHESEADVQPSDSATDGRQAYRLCRISSVQLALPAEHLAEAVPLPPLLNYSAPDWFLGRHHHDGIQLHVLDLARIVAPDVPRAQADVLVPIRSRPWAMACTLDPESAWLAHDEIQWREPGGMRPWLTGMSRDGRCAIIDVCILLDLLETDPRFHPEPGKR